MTTNEVEPKPKPLNPLFVMLTICSALPTLFFGALMVSSRSDFWGLLFAWSAAWTYVWWKMRFR